MEQRVALYTPREVAALLKVSERTVRRWIGQGKLVSRRFGRQLRISSETLNTFGQTPPPSDQADDWPALAVDSFAKDWENDRDAAYDRWQEHYGVPTR